MKHKLPASLLSVDTSASSTTFLDIGLQADMAGQDVFDSCDTDHNATQYRTFTNTQRG